LIDALHHTLEVMRLHEGKWLLIDIYRGDAKVRAEPFDAIELDLGLLWASVAPPQPTRASEAAAEHPL